MKRSAVAAYLLLGVACSAGCSSIDCCRWWQRNSDGSNNYDRPKPIPVQAGPIAGTYQQPTTGTVIQPSGMNTPLMNTNTPPSPPVVVTSPAQAAPPPSNTVTPPPMNLAPPGVFPQQPPSAPPTLLGPTSNSSPLGGQGNQQGTGIVQNMPSITSPIMPDVAVKGPSIDLTVAGASGPAPMLMAPTVGNQAVEKSLAQLSGPTIPMPQTSMPQLTTPPTIPMPQITGMAAPRAVSLNPGTVPPPLTPAPQVPQFDNR
jgi:hypothetical protein